MKKRKQRAANAAVEFLRTYQGAKGGIENYYIQLYESTSQEGILIDIYNHKEGTLLDYKFFRYADF